ncbi:dipeptide/oligopeptide/nickel ABC transporter ATP-binding protein [Halalkalibacterium halodurans]|uniref:Peptide ABC transporter ATPase n=1 Tax=Halalkalibacterium halodurans TaxID=86665 RepID=A0A0M0KK84_ALKHA|nr:dipeptide/oligopeptide/nickel ABC transporter ATP-binding protein [Halalkalibacterium halodurans]MDY7222360.1 dipeptide/oligopeptide/nickel ABC transporter ATP-binding protein [Halalkalibacterium halodurans]MDY7241581.1 dipeptide/oligopeptide/nickel ABC transporter ATP-binding protein [Halalkalibacterium halodurans]MED4082333.1 dipeptide/oligopeptide/nickel ABC transporter ATP-binding protein [Halalkalibacterium halodurans]MED4083516.1 dipeptide/oligopeptide/nickel ABC transporter ATP-bindin
MTLLSVDHLVKSYGTGKVAISDVSFDVNKGECLGLVGESGCGKSTLARCLLRIESIDRGSITFKHQSIERLKERRLRPFRKDLQAVFQNPTAALNPKLKVKDSLLDPYDQYKQGLKLRHFSYTSKNAFVRQLLEAVELPSSLAERYPHELSGGQRQRVTIARAISIEPALIILDEPTASLDVISQGAILRLLSDLRNTLNVAYLFISHDLAAVEQMSQRIIVMKDGTFVDEFQSDHLFSEGRHPYTKELISIF